MPSNFTRQFIVGFISLMSDKIVNWFYANKVQYLNIILFQISEFVIDTEIFFFSLKIFLRQ